MGASDCRPATLQFYEIERRYPGFEAYLARVIREYSLQLCQAPFTMTISRYLRTTRCRTSDNYCVATSYLHAVDNLGHPEILYSCYGCALIKITQRNPCYSNRLFEFSFRLPCLLSLAHLGVTSLKMNRILTRLSKEGSTHKTLGTPVSCSSGGLRVIALTRLNRPIELRPGIMYSES